MRLPGRGLLLFVLVSLTCLWSLGPLSAQPGQLQVASGVGVPGGSVNLALSYQANGGPSAAALQWTLAYPATQFSDIAVAEGTAATSAGKTVSCAGGNGTYTCLAVGLNTNVIPDGVVAVASVTIAAQAGTGSSPIGLANPVAVSPSGDSLAVAGAGGAVTIQAPGPGIGQLSCDPDSFRPPGTTQCTVTLTTVAGGSPIPVLLSTDNPHIGIPGTVVVPSGSDSATFGVSGVTVTSQETGLLTARLGSSSTSTLLTILPGVALSELACNPLFLQPPGITNCSVTLIAPAGSGGTRVFLSTNNPNVGIPSSVTVPAGATSTAFGVSGATVAAEQQAEITATLQQVTRSVVVSVLPQPNLSSLVCDPDELVAAEASTCVVGLTTIAPAAGRLVLISSSASDVSVPASITVPAGEQSHAFTATTAAQVSNGPVMITVTSGGISVEEVLTLTAPVLSVVSEWRFEETEAGGGVAIADSSGSGYDGITFGPGSVPHGGVQGGARVFNGANDYIQIPGGAGLTPNSFTIRTWVKVQSYPTSLGVLLSSYDGNHRGWYLAVIPSGQVVFMTARPPNVSRWLVSTSILTRHDWHSVAVTFDAATNQAALYIDGLPDRSVTVPGIEPNTTVNPTLAGASWSGGYRFRGALDETRITSGVLNPSEVLSDHLEFLPPAPPVDPITVANWKFEDEGSDSSGNQNHATLTGTQLIQGVVGDGRRFNGLGDHLETAIPDLFYPSGFTFRTWLKLHSYPTASSLGVIASIAGDGFRGWYLGVNWDGRVTLNVAALPGSTSTLFSNSALSLNRWYHVAATYDSASGAGRVFVDGLVAGQGAFPGFTPETDIPLTVARASWTDSNYLHFDADEMVAYSESRTSAQILDDYQSFAVPPPDAPTPAGEWHFDEVGPGAGVTLLDSSGNGLHAVTQGSGTLDVAGVGGVARQFDGPGNYAAILPSPEFGAQSFSFSTWARLDSYPNTTGWGAIISNYGGDYKGWFLGVTASGQVIFSVAGLPTSSAWLVSHDSLMLNNWYHLAVTFDGATRQGAIYVNGVMVRSAVFAAYTPQTDVAPTFARASWYWGAFLRCSLDEGRLFSSRLTPAEVMSEYNAIP